MTGPPSDVPPRPSRDDDPAAVERHGVRFHGARWLLLLAVAVLTYALYPGVGGVSVPALSIGQVAPNDIVAPFEFVVKKSAAEIEREGNALASTVRPIIDVRPGVVDSAAAQASALFAALDSATSPGALVDSAHQHAVPLDGEEAGLLMEPGMRTTFRRAVLEMIRTQLSRGVAANASIDSTAAPEFVVRRSGTERLVRRDSILTFQRYLDLRRKVERVPNSSVGDRIFVKLLNATFRATLVPNARETSAMRNELRASVDSVKDVVRANERIVAAHEVVTPDVRDRLLALRSELARRGGATGRSVPSAAGQILTNALILSIFWLLLTFYRRETYDNMRQMLLVALLVALVVTGGAVNLRFISPGPELIPIPFAAMLLTVLFSGRVAIVAAAVLAVLIGTQSAYGGEPAVYLALIGGVASAMGVRGVRRRSELLVTVLIVAGAFALGAFSVGLRLGWSPAEMGESALRGAINAVISSSLVIITLPIFESIGRLTTDVTLLELSDPSRPLLRRLATEAPGTYAHSVAMANLCEAACNAIGANGLLARVGCYYHDVGKISKPMFFVENQGRGGNPHDKMPPEASAAVIRNHVREGVRLAEEYGLPDVVKAFIPEHHGTAEITYFLERAKAGGNADASRDEQYRYPGPNPQSVETAVAMLADGVEAAIRVLDEPSPDKVREAIDHLVERRVESGLLRDAPLTLRQLDRVKREFVRVLSGMHHNRIDYPTVAGGLSAQWEPSPRA